MIEKEANLEKTAIFNDSERLARVLCVKGFRIFGEIPERPNGTDCKSVVLRLRRFESSFPHGAVLRNQFRCKMLLVLVLPGLDCF